MKIDIKIGIIVILVGVLAFLMGRNSSQNTKSGAPVSTASVAPDGKLAKNYKQKEIVKTIRANAKDLQSCYLTYLEKKGPVNEGVIKILFLLRENGSVSEARTISNEFPDINFGECVASKMKSYHFAPPPLGINRNIIHELAFKTQETAEREAKERLKKNSLPKVLPVGPGQ